MVMNRHILRDKYGQTRIHEKLRISHVPQRKGKRNVTWVVELHAAEAGGVRVLVFNRFPT